MRLIFLPKQLFVGKVFAVRPCYLSLWSLLPITDNNVTWDNNF